MRTGGALLCLFLSCAPALAEDIAGVPQIVDGDTIYVAARKIRLSGVDAPETDQVCLDAAAQPSSCGIQAKDALTEHFGGRQLTCTLSGTDLYGRNLGDCFLGSESMSRWLVRNGWALAFRKYSTAFVTDEDYARERKAGLWGGAFIAPWDWRHRNRHTIVLGAVAVPRDAQRKLLAPANVSEPPDPRCVIKANMKRSGECIYHVPGGRFYDRLRMDRTSSRRWFCTPAEAEAAGCRRSKL
jgi:endonuclease YncB( thermonuclease family)